MDYTLPILYKIDPSTHKIVWASEGANIAHLQTPVGENVNCFLSSLDASHNTTLFSSMLESLDMQAFDQEQLFPPKNPRYHMTAANGLICIQELRETKDTQRETEYTILKQLARQLPKANGVHEVLQKLLEACLKCPFIDSGGVYLFEKPYEVEKGSIVLQCHRGLSPDFVQRASVYGPGTPQRQLILDGKCMWIDYQDFLRKNGRSCAEEEILSVGILPIHANDTVVGCVNVASHTVLQLQSMTQFFLEAVIGQIGLVLELHLMHEKEMQSKECLGTLIDTMSEFISVLDLKGNVIAINKRWESIGYERSDLIGKNVVLIHPEEKRSEAISIVSSMQAGLSSSCTIPIVSKDGKWIPVDTTISFGTWMDQRVIIGLSRDLTDVQSREAQLHAAQRVSHTGSFVWDWTTGTVSETYECHRILHIPEGNVVSKIEDIFERIDSMDRDMVCEKFQSHCSTNEPFDVTIHIENSNTIARFRGNVSDITGKTVCTLQDITEERMFQHNLKRMSAFLETVIDQSTTAIVIVDEDRRTRFVNEQASKLFAYHSQRRKSLSLEDLYENVAEMISDDGEKLNLLSFVDRCFEEGKKMNWTGRVIQKSGKKSNIILVAGPVFQELDDVLSGIGSDPNLTSQCETGVSDSEVQSPRHLRSPTAVVLTLVDVTDLRNAREELQLARDQQFELLSVLFEANPVAMCLLDPQSKKIGIFNQSYASFFEKTSTSVDEEAFDHPSWFDAVQPLWKQSSPVEKGEDQFIFSTETLMTNVGERVFMICCSSIVLRGVDNAVVTFVDLTREKLAEKHSLELQRHIHESQKLQSLGRFAGGIAHDFNNLLAAVSGSVELLKLSLNTHGTLDHSSIQILDDMLTVCLRGEGTVKRLLSVSRPEKPQRDLEMVDIAHVVENVVAILKPTVLDKRIEITLKTTKKFVNKMTRKGDMEEKTPSNRYALLGDSSELENAFINIAINGIHAMEGTSGSLSFTLDIVKKVPSSIRFPLQHANKRASRFFKIMIRDTGSGIAPEHMDLIFDPFFSTKPRDKGTGLGLPGVYTAIQHFDGGLDVASEVGKGTLFSLYLPATKRSRRSLPLPLVGLDAAEVEVRGKTILLVDDERIILLVGEKILRERDHTVLKAENGKEAVKLYAQHWETIDLVIMDMYMPVMTGKEAFFEMKKINPDVKVIISSGFIEKDDVKEMMKNGAFGELSKPFKVGKLFEMLQKAFAPTLR
eukprot:TRINITY_DN2193_c0_g1_i2.p1 TRINITY_DN2193_c0_g1~~TRINITY_DN2193_c0_g1_i2.p1  ORF type:complete len:1219 (+),score=330.27 TRINITY_DN2193_c0_g1_i2:3336-6992(+)